MINTKKRGYSPTIDDIRQYNIKKFRLIEDLDSMNLSNTQPEIQHAGGLKLDKNREFIADIDEFLIQNQDDDEIIESSKQITDLQTVDPEHIVIPSVITQRLPIYGDEIDVERSRSKRGSFRRYGTGNAADDEDILRDYTMLKRWALVKYVDPYQCVYRVWERWYFDVFKLNELSQAINCDDNDMMIDDVDDEQVYQPKIRNHYGGYYYDMGMDDNVLNDLDEEDAMDIDE